MLTLLTAHDAAILDLALLLDAEEVAIDYDGQCFEVQTRDGDGATIFPCSDGTFEVTVFVNRTTRWEQWWDEYVTDHKTAEDALSFATTFTRYED